MALSPSFAGLILAAGASSRMGRDKALLPWRDGTFLSAALRALQSVTELVIVVAGANALNLKPIADANAAFLVVNPDPQQGQFSSLLVGLRDVLNRGRDAVIITLVAPVMIYVSNEDKPGFIGRFATLLGDAAINIATFALGRDREGGSAIALVEVDGPVPEKVLAEIATLPGVKEAKALAF